MTREEAKEIMSKVTFYWELGEQTLTQNQINEALDMAIKALEAPPNDNWEGYSSRLWKSAYERGKAEAEQTSVLDKARAEIAAYGSIWVEYSIPGHTDHDIEVIVENVLKQAKEQVLAVIDKYRESEGEIADD